MSEDARPTTRTTTGELGARAEAIAERWLVARGLRTVLRNYRWRGGEIDLAMHDSDQTLAIVEVRYRRRTHLVTPQGTVTAAKRRRLITTTRHLLARHPEIPFELLRFDVVAVSGALERPTLHWLRNAFTADR